MYTIVDFTPDNNGGIPLSSSVLQKMELLFGIGFSDVRLHISSVPERFGARAFAMGSSIYFAPGFYEPETAAGLGLLAHELTHVAQQRAGRARNPGGAGLAILEDQEMENEANSMALCAVVERHGRSLLAEYRRGTASPEQGRIVQMCKYCGNWQCLDGEKCKQGKTMGGLFESTITPPQVSEHSETRKFSKRGVQESEHVVPHSALKQGHASFTYNSEPTISIPYEMHRGGVSGSGGGVTSTGSSGVAKEWSKQLGEDISSGDFYSALKKTTIDGLNSAWMSGHLSIDIVNGYIQVVNMHATEGRITQIQAGELSQILFNYFWNRTGQK